MFLHFATKGPWFFTTHSLTPLSPFMLLVLVYLRLLLQCCLGPSHTRGEVSNYGLEARSNYILLLDCHSCPRVAPGRRRETPCLRGPVGITVKVHFHPIFRDRDLFIN